jgi:hypothetical protein
MPNITRGLVGDVCAAEGGSHTFERRNPVCIYSPRPPFPRPSLCGTLLSPPIFHPVACVRTGNSNAIVPQCGRECTPWSSPVCAWRRTPMPPSWLHRTPCLLPRYQPATASTGERKLRRTLLTQADAMLRADGGTYWRKTCSTMLRRSVHDSSPDTLRDLCCGSLFLTPPAH